jgi:hypothetical protein
LVCKIEKGESLCLKKRIIIKKKLTEEEVKFLQQIKKELNEKQRENNEISNT